MVDVAAFVYGVFAMVRLAMPGRSVVFLNDWIVLIDLAIVMGVGLLCLFIARPDRTSDGPEGDAIHVAELLRSHGK